ncbi:MAG: hypothetical protein ABEH59_03965 [Halobacteriales archaeon]
MTSPGRTDGGVNADPNTDSSELEELVRKAVWRTYPSDQLDEDVEYIDVHYDQYDGDAHILRVRAPDHELLEYKRWLVVTIEGRGVHLRGAGDASPSEYYVRAKLGDG